MREALAKGETYSDRHSDKLTSECTSCDRGVLVRRLIVFRMPEPPQPLRSLPYNIAGCPQTGLYELPRSPPGSSTSLHGPFERTPFELIIRYGEFKIICVRQDHSDVAFLIGVMES